LSRALFATDGVAGVAGAWPNAAGAELNSMAAAIATAASVEENFIVVSSSLLILAVVSG
jgi:hypothetical protein